MKLPTLSMPRSWELWVVGLALGALMLWLFPQRLAGELGMVTRFALAGAAGYVVDRLSFPYSRPHEAKSLEDQRRREIRRAVIIAGCMIGAGMAL